MNGYEQMKNSFLAELNKVAPGLLGETTRLISDALDKAAHPFEVMEYLRLACKNPRDKAILEFFYSTGCRVTELIGVKKEDIDWKNNSVHLFGKGQKHRTSFINAKCEVTLKEYLKTREDNNEHPFVSMRKPHNQLTKGAIEKIIKELANSSAVTKHVTPHILRHTTATQAVNNGIPIEGVSKLLGHANVTTIIIYAKVSQENIQTQHTKYIT